MLAAFVRRKVNIMGWFSTATALKLGQGAYGNVKESLHGESDPFRTLSVALEKVEYEIVNGYYFPDKKAKARLAYWSRRIGRRLTMRAIETGKRLCQNAKPVDCKMRAYNSWRWRNAKAGLSSQT